MTELTPRPKAQREDLITDTLPPALRRADPVTELPLLMLYPHSRCNCRCVMCDIWRASGKEELTTSEVAKWLPEWRRLGVKRVILSGGEPLMHSQVWPLCDLLASAGVGITIISTGLLLERHATALVRVCDDVVVSLDGPPDVHDRIRNVPRAFERLARGVAAVKAAEPGVRVSGRCTVQYLNFRALRRTVRTAHDLGLDGISFLAVDVSTEAFNRPGGWSDERVRQVALAEGDLPLLSDELDMLQREHASDFSSGYIAESPAKLRRRLEQYFTALLGTGDFAAVECNAPWVSTVIETDGTVRPCFFQPPLGNVREAGSLDRVLNSPQARAWRRRLDTRRNDICRRCVCSLLLRGGAVSSPSHGSPS
jgi:radical SAM protein with 4Fe4S-binding SPASM domain